MMRKIISRQAAAFGHFGDFCQRPHTIFGFFARLSKGKDEI